MPLPSTGFSGTATVRRLASDRILSLFALFTSAGFVFYLILLLPTIVGQAGRTDPWWAPTAAVAVFGCGLAMGVASFARGTRALRVTAGATAVAYLLAVATWPLAWNGPELSDPQGVWLSTFPGVAGLAAVAAWRPATAFTYLVITCTAVQFVNNAARDDAAGSPLVPDIAFSIMFCTLFVGAAVMALRTGRVLDETTDSTHAAAAAAAAQHARTVERERFDALIHDGVMSTLLAASRQGATPRVAEHSVATMRQLDALRAEGGSQEHFDTETVLSHLRTAATDVDAGVTLQVARHPDGSGLAIPADTARAMGAALAEALRNSLRHGGVDADPQVLVAVAADRISVQVADHGPGFDPDTVPAHRLGVTVSILGRMSQQPGGAARIVSRPGNGTRVYLSWCVS